MDAKIGAKEALDLFFGRSDAMQQFWTIYVTMILGILAFFGTGKARSWAIAVFICLAFSGFATVNLFGIRDVARQRVEICGYLAHRECNFGVGAVTIADPLPVTLRPWPVWEVVTFHIAADIATIVAVLFLTVLGRRDPSRKRE